MRREFSKAKKKESTETSRSCSEINTNTNTRGHTRAHKDDMEMDPKEKIDNEKEPPKDE